MSPRKLTEDDKQSMLKLYRNSKATTSTLASEFGVSSSTVSRFLKNNLDTEEYDDLIQQKRLARTAKGNQAQKITTKKKAKSSKKVQLKDSSGPILAQDNGEEIDKVSKITKKAKKVISSRKSSTSSPLKLEESIPESSDQEVVDILPIDELKTSAQKVSTAEPVNQFEEEDDDDFDVNSLVEIIGEEIEDDDELDEDDDELDDDELDEDDDELVVKSYPDKNVDKINLEIIPLASASLPRTCYLVIDRSSELIVKPLQEFSDLVSIPDQETQQKTLPVFDNHRVAKRFSHRREKVIKVPDGKMLQQTSAYLYEKGITRLLIKGKLYGISKN